MSWQHRVFRDEDGSLTIRETYYDENGQVYGWTGPMEPIGFPEDRETGEPGNDTDALLGLGWDLAKFQGALCFPIIDEQGQLEIIRRKQAESSAEKETLKKSEE